MNPKVFNYNDVNGVPDPHPCCYDICVLNPEEYDEDYLRLVNCVQRHVCRVTGYCKSKKKKLANQCRFGFPFKTRDRSEIIFNETQTKVSAEIETKRNDPYMNPHIRLATHEWRGNTDAQAILDAKAAQDYIAKYACKGEVAGQALKDILRIVSLSIQDDSNPINKLKSIFLRTTCSKRDRGIGEVSRMLLGNPLYHSTFTYVYGSLDLTSKQMDDDISNAIANINETNQDQPITKKSLLDIYGKRKTNNQLITDLHNIKSYLDFLKKYYVYANKLKARNQKEIDKIVIVTTPKVYYSSIDLKKLQKYSYFQYIKYADWDSESIKELTMENSIEKLNEFLNRATPETINEINFTVDLSNRLQEIREEEHDQDPQQRRHRAHWMEFADQIPIDLVDQDEYHAMIDKNYDWSKQNDLFTTEQIQTMKDCWLERQKEFEDILTETNCPVVYRHQLNRLQKFAYDIIQEFRTSKRQVLMIINGGAGSGKTFTINAICTDLNERIKRAAPTAKAAFLINGETLHALFSIPVHETGGFKDLDDGTLKRLQEIFKYVQFIIIDEYSMLSQTMLSKIDFRLRQISQKHGLRFGGFSLILTGDPVQLPAVAAPSLYDTKLLGQLNTNGFNAYKEFTIVVKFEQVMRQQIDDDPDQAHFVDLLTRFRTGDCTIADWKLLCKRFPDSKSEVEFKDAPRLYPENLPCDKFNIERIATLGQPIIDFHAKNEPHTVRRYNSDSFNGLTNLIYMAPEAQVVITTNIWKRKGVLNGANGTIKSILFDKPNERTSTTLPHTVVVHIPAYSGPQLFPEPERHNWVPINPHTQWSMVAKGHRTQLPFRLAYAMTVHKSQGQTLDKGVIDFTSSEQALGSAYVQVTRFKHIKHFLIKPFPYARITSIIKKAKNFQVRLDEEKRLQNLTETTLVRFRHLLNAIDSEQNLNL